LNCQILAPALPRLVEHAAGADSDYVVYAGFTIKKGGIEIPPFPFFFQPDD
jgi:hypothetical protein